jgi:hypothetical protein
MSRQFTRDFLIEVMKGNVSGHMHIPQGPELSLSEKTDIWFEAYGDGAASAVSIDFELLLVDN